MSSLQVKIVVIVAIFIVVAAVLHVLFMYPVNKGSESLTVHMVSQQWQQEEQSREEQRQKSDDAILRAVYFDDRARNGHDKIGVFLVELKEAIFTSNLITGCGVGNKLSSKFKLRELQENRLMHNWIYVQLKKPHFAYEEFILECYDIPMTNGSNAFILFKTASNSPVYVATSEFPVMFPAPRVQPTGPGKYDFSVVTCTEAHNKKVSWLREFIRYQKTLGVDHVHVNILDTFINDGGLDTLLKDSQVAEGVANGYVTMTVWKDILETSGKVYSYSAILRKLDCVYRFRGTYDYAFLFDSDDFFNPLIHGEKYAKHYIQNWCRSDKSVGSCYFNWYYFYPEVCGLREETAEDGNLTKLLKSYKWTSNNHFKSVHLISALVDAGYHHADCRDCLLRGYRAIHIDPSIAYVAHLRKSMPEPPGGC